MAVVDLFAVDLVGGVAGGGGGEKEKVRETEEVEKKKALLLLLRSSDSINSCCSLRAGVFAPLFNYPSDEDIDDLYYPLTRIKSLPRPWYLANLTLLAIAAATTTALARD